MLWCEGLQGFGGGGGFIYAVIIRGLNGDMIR